MVFQCRLRQQLFSPAVLLLKLTQSPGVVEAHPYVLGTQIALTHKNILPNPLNSQQWRYSLIHLEYQSPIHHS